MVLMSMILYLNHSVRGCGCPPASRRATRRRGHLFRRHERPPRRRANQILHRLCECGGSCGALTHTRPMCCRRVLPPFPASLYCLPWSSMSGDGLISTCRLWRSTRMTNTHPRRRSGSNFGADGTMNDIVSSHLCRLPVLDGYDIHCETLTYTHAAGTLSSTSCMIAGPPLASKRCVPNTNTLRRN